MSARFSRWSSVGQVMTACRQRELVEEYIATLPDLPGGCPRELQPPRDDPRQSLRRDERVELAPSTLLPTLTGVYLKATAGKRSSWKTKELLLDYRGWIVSEAEYRRYGYAVHTAVHLPGLFDSNRYLLLGDPTAPAAQINCITGTKEKANAKLVLDSKAVKAATAASAEGVSQSIVTVRVASAAVRAGDELWIDYSATYWRQMSLYCPHCLEYGADEDDQMLLCDTADCKRAWHQLCLRPCLVDVPESSFFCDIHH
jgi:hypothetical protein